MLTQRKVELAAAEEAAKASPEDQKEVSTAHICSVLCTHGGWDGGGAPGNVSARQ